MNSKSFSDFIKLIGKSILVILLYAAIGTGLLVAVSFIPQKAIYENTKNATRLLSEEGSGIDILSLRGSSLDVFTDSLMLSTAFESAGDLHETLMATRLLEGEDDQPLVTLQKYFNGDTADLGTGEYARYWHGYLVYLRPLLCIGNLISIRALNMLLQFALITIVICLFLRRGGCEDEYFYPVLHTLDEPISGSYKCIYAVLFSFLFYDVRRDLHFAS